MVRKQLYITEEQDALLKRLAHERGATEAELVRLGINLLSDYSQNEEQRRNREAESLIAFMNEHAAVHREGATWKFDRDALYDEDERYVRLLRGH